ncbi:MAG: hypothetical protein M0Z57_02340 [Deltaproteobacteria bacterium]|jgi:hypothetical protein|nr:hypothetical protein [Deltaproteobacteria bacterium]
MDINSQKIKKVSISLLITRISIDIINKKEYINSEGLSSYLSPYFIEKIEINREIEDMNITKNRERASNLKEKFIKEDCNINSLLK